MLCCSCGFDPAIERRRHPAQYRLANVTLHISENLPAIRLIPAPVQVFGSKAKLDDEIAR
jgi:hypothetical protein